MYIYMYIYVYMFICILRFAWIIGLPIISLIMFGSMSSIIISGSMVMSRRLSAGEGSGSGVYFLVTT